MRADSSINVLILLAATYRRAVSRVVAARACSPRDYVFGTWDEGDVSGAPMSAASAVGDDDDKDLMDKAPESNGRRVILCKEALKYHVDDAPGAGVADVAE